MNAGKNAEGYADPTASEAIKNVYKEEKMKSTTPTEVKRGDVWQIKLDTGEITCLVLAKQGDTLTVVKLFDEWRSDSDIEVNALGKMLFGCSAKLSYTFDDRAVQLIRVLKEPEWQKIQNTIMKRFGIEATPQEAPEPQVIEKVVEKVVEVPADAQIAEKIKDLRETIKDLEEADGKLSQARTARFICRYMDVLGL